MSKAVIRTATKTDAEDIYQVVQHTIKTIYPQYYPDKVVDFFSQLHSLKNICQSFSDGTQIFVVEVEGEIIGMGSCLGQHITRVFIEPEFQRMGYGGLLMQKLEDFVAQKHSSVVVDSSLSASIMYEKRGYGTVNHEVIDVNGAFLVYEVMRKSFV